ncbi:NAD-dependent epimerase/dehydratase family protein [Crocinitomix catalasitica]|uniref:NAD-dependent epimerase/dehydratase family protein n=1 Tax=Crocinitomix catalasitica TaxID=184607 RepID=UPI0004893152|nr:NAD-dependent epimerase/dehydratase family protein [Crocinitomix catalasitica]
MNLKSLVTGGAGFIGSHVVDQLIANGHEVIILDDLSGGVIDNINPAAIFCKGSITDVTLVNELFKEYNFDYVYHLAAYAAEGLSHFIRKFNYENNLIGSINLINVAVNFNVKCFVFTSSIAVYGQNELPYHEGQFPNPEDPYGIAKFAVEMDLKNAKSMFGLNSIIFRPHNVFGARQNIGDKYRNVVGIFMNQLLKNQPLSVFGDGNQSRAFTAIDDVAPFIANAVNIDAAYNKVFNIGSDNPITIIELIAALNKITGINAQPNFLEAREEVEHAYANHNQFNDQFEPGSVTPFSKALSEMWEWVQKNGAKESREFDNIEILKELPSAWRK